MLARSGRGQFTRAALYKDDGATFDDLREAATTLEDTERTARRVFGGAHPITKGIEVQLRNISSSASIGAKIQRQAAWRVGCVKEPQTNQVAQRTVL